MKHYKILFNDGSIIYEQASSPYDLIVRYDIKTTEKVQELSEYEFVKATRRGE